MKTHVQLVAVLHVAMGAFALIAAIAILTGGIFMSQVDHKDASIIGTMVIALSWFLAALSLPSIIGGWALFTGRSWGRLFVLVLGALQLLSFPIGTALGIYTFWAFLYSPESQSVHAPSILSKTETQQIKNQIMNTPEKTTPLENIVYHQHEYNNQPRNTSGLAVTSMIMGILSLLGGAFFILPPLLAVIFGHCAVGSCNKNRMLDGKGMAIAGLVMGWICLAGWIIIFLFFGGLAVLGISAAAASSAF